MSNEPSSIIAVIFTFILGLFSSCNVSFPSVTATDTAYEMIFSMDSDNPSGGALEQTVSILEARLGSSVLNIKPIGSTDILMSLPATTFAEQERIVRLATQQGVLNFQMVKEGVAKQDLTVADLETPIFAESIISQATTQPDSIGQPSIFFEVHADYQTALGQLTRDNIGRRLAIVLDGDVLIAPLIQGQISESGVISGGETLEESQDIVNLLNTGPLPYPLTFEVIRSTN